MTQSLEQLRRLKNTIMGAGHRLTVLARSGELPPESEVELRALSSELADVVGRLERLLTRLRQDR
ncbi:MAG TPA: hypothetical protein VIO62_08025 [Candidatus Dormibacteraeota bacterium]|jgi:hypothetical protein